MDDGVLPCVTAMVDTITKLVTRGPDGAPGSPTPFSVSTLPAATVIAIARAAQAIFSAEPPLIHLRGEFVVVGDVHGHLQDLLRAFQEFGLPPATKYVILGDFVDKGQFSVHTATFLFALKCCHPRAIYILRGNHEFTEVNEIYGLLAEVRQDYSSAEVHAVLNTTFAAIPLAFTLNSDYLCVHGGIGPDFTSLDQLSGAPVPPAVVEAVVWSDPNPSVVFAPNRKRGRGFEFGEKPLADFLAKNRLKAIIRGHSFVPEGVRTEFDGRLITVFSASNYAEPGLGKSGILQIAPGAPPRIHQLSTLPEVSRRTRTRSSSLKMHWPLDTSQPATDHKGPPIVMLGVVKRRVPSPFPGMGRCPITRGTKKP